MTAYTDTTTACAGAEDDFSFVFGASLFHDEPFSPHDEEMLKLRLCQDMNSTEMTVSPQELLLDMSNPSVSPDKTAALSTPPLSSAMAFPTIEDWDVGSLPPLFPDVVEDNFSKPASATIAPPTPASPSALFSATASKKRSASAMSSDDDDDDGRRDSVAAQTRVVRTRTKATRTPPPIDTATENDPVKLKRMRNTMAARKSRGKRREEVDSLRAQNDALWAENDQLRKRLADIESVLAKALGGSK